MQSPNVHTRSQELQQLARALLWSRVEALQNIDRQVDEMDDAIQLMAERHRAIQAEIQTELVLTRKLAEQHDLSADAPDLPTVYYLSKVLALLLKDQ